MKKRKIKSYQIKTINTFLTKRIFAIPRLQRDFVWSDKKACALLDSIYHDYPIGTIMIWNTKKTNQHNFNIDLTALPPYSSSNNNRVYFIIDGQQRLSVLFRITEGGKIINSNGKEIDFGKIFFDINEEKFAYLKRYNEDEQVRVTDLLSSKWKYIFHNYPKYKFQKIEKCRKRLKSYSIDFKFISTNNMDEIRNTFVRINTTGTPLSSADKAFTLATSFNLKNRINVVRFGFTKGFENIDRIFLLRAIALIYNTPQVNERGISAVIKKIEESEEEQKDFDEIWKYLSQSYGIAIDYLISNFFVYNFNLIPSANMIPILATFFYHNSNKQPNYYQRMQIRKWFWYTGITGRYSGAGYHTNIIKDYKLFSKIGNDIKKPFKIDEKINITKIKFSDYSSGSSLTSAFLCLLASKKPRYLDGGTEIPLSQYNALANKKNKHHIFPRAHLKNKEFSKNYYNSIGNICYFTWQDNIKVGSNPPYKYLCEYKKDRSLQSILNSHLIPNSKNDGLWMKDTKKGYGKFLNTRVHWICNQFEKLSGTILFEI